MIIVKTKKGDMFLNDKETDLVRHDKEKEKVYINGERFGMQCAIENVEQVIYVSDAQPMEWKDTGSEIERLLNKLKIYKNHGNEWALIARTMRTNYMDVRSTLEDIFETLTETQQENIRKSLNDIDERLDKMADEQGKIMAERERLAEMEIEKL